MTSTPSKSNLPENDSLKELRAYNIGYDLGWYRAHESISNEMQEIADAILNSAIFKEIQREHSTKPIFLAKILDLIMQMNEMRNEKMPVLLLEREKINEIGAKIAKLPVEAFKDPISFTDTKMLSDKEKES
ncbi:MAG TPA: hypothetical protein VNG32_00460 [Candidatus Dormibacteraeota bacterium]|nr:hypothetical protein [Candidatus Dormibacteraeota bacterium]